MTGLSSYILPGRGAAISQGVVVIPTGVEFSTALVRNSAGESPRKLVYMGPLRRALPES